MKKKTNNVGKIVAVGVLGLVLGAATGGMAFYNPYSASDMQQAVQMAREQAYTNGVNSVDVDAIKQGAFASGAASVEPIVINDTQIVEKEVEVEVPVDNGDMDFVLCRLEDQGVIQDCDDIVGELKQEDAALEKAFAFVDENQDDLFDLLEDEGIVSDEDDVSIVKVYDDYDDVVVVQADYDDDKFRFRLEYKVEDEDSEDKLKILVDITVEDGDVTLDDVQEL